MSTTNESDISGLMSDQVKLRKVRDNWIVRNKPRRRVASPPTAKQLDVQHRLQEAAQYASGQNETPDAHALYATGIDEKKKSAYAVALSDFLVAPIVTSINTEEYHGAMGDNIQVRAIDDFMVTKVKVTILDPAGATLESGDATLNPSLGNWVYKATVANPTLTGTTIKAVAYDRPGNTGMEQTVL